MQTKLRPNNCECDNTHEQNNTCCMSCWHAGFRHVPADEDTYDVLAQLDNNSFEDSVD